MPEDHQNVLADLLNAKTDIGKCGLRPAASRSWPVPGRAKGVELDAGLRIRAVPARTVVKLLHIRQRVLEN